MGAKAMKETDAVVTLVLAFLTFAAFLFWAGMARADEAKPKVIYSLQYDMQFDSKYTIGGGIPFISIKDCWTVAQHLSILDKAENVDITVTFGDFCKESKQ